MGASDLIGRLAIAGIRLSTEGANVIVESDGAPSEEVLAMIRANKPTLLAALAPVEGDTEIRQRRILAKLAMEPDKSRVAIFDTDAERDFVICTLAVRNVGTCELRIPRDCYDPWLILEALDKTH